MQKKAIIRKIVAFSFVFLLAFFVGSFSLAADDYGLSETANTVAGGDGGQGYNYAATYTDKGSFYNLIGKYVGVILSFVGVLFFGLMIYGGFLWMTARGDEKQVGTAKELIYAAVIGLIIIVSAYTITSFIGSRASFDVNAK